jgi:hypothetical protein
MSGQIGPTGPTGPTGGTGQGGMFAYWNSGANLANNNFLLYGNMTTTESFAQIVITKTSTVSNLVVKLVGSGSINPGTGSRTFTIRKNGVNTALSVTITGAATTGSDLVDTVSVAQFDLISIEQTQSAPQNPAGGTVSVQII